MIDPIGSLPSLSSFSLEQEIIGPTLCKTGFRPVLPSWWQDNVVMLPLIPPVSVLPFVPLKPPVDVTIWTGTLVTGLELGADDYVTKPFSPRVLLARVKAVLRRGKTSPTEAEGILKIHDIMIHPGRREVRVEGKAVSLTFTEFGILHHLAQRPGWVFTRFQIVDAIRGDDYPVTDRSVDVQIVGLRKKLGPAGAHIETVRGVGYRFRE